MDLIRRVVYLVYLSIAYMGYLQWKIVSKQNYMQKLQQKIYNYSAQKSRYQLKDKEGIYKKELNNRTQFKQYSIDKSNVSMANTATTFPSLHHTLLPKISSCTVVDGLKLNSKSVVVYDLESQQQLFKVNDHEKREIASLTKIMVCWVTIQYVRKNQLIPQNEFLVVSKNAAAINGTKAQLQQGDTLSIWDLLHGLMLPSGNDAALCLAENIGKILNHNKKTSLDNFVQEMNIWAQRFEMKDTVYVNPHGLSNRNNKSTVCDQLVLIQEALKDSLFKKIIDKRLYFCSIQEKDGWTRELFWENTNKLLFKGFSGIKTGSTTTAGYCLASWFKKDNINLLIVTLGANTSDERFNDAIKLVKWAISEKLSKTSKQIIDYQL